MGRLRRTASGPQEIISTVEQFETKLSTFSSDVMEFVNNFNNWFNSNSSGWTNAQQGEVDGIKYEMEQLIDKLKYIDEDFNMKVADPLNQAVMKWDELKDEEY